MGRRRLSPQQKQENISRKQFEEYLEQHEWVVTDVIPDLGEDILVRVYDEGISTGISLYIQLKSTKDLMGLKLRSGKISYSFDVADLEHWDVQGIPVLLVIWDIKLKTGCYVWVDEAIAGLKSKKTDWRSQKTSKVHFPADNAFNEDAFLKLKRSLAEHYYPIISKKKDIVIKASFEFPPTDEGKTKLAELEKHFALGDEVEVVGEYIKEFKVSDWWIRLFGSPDTGKMHLKLGPPKDPPIHQFQFDFVSSEYGILRLPRIDLCLVKVGTEEATISNAQQTIPFKFTLVLSKITNRLQLNITIDLGNFDGYDAMQILELQRILSREFQVRIKDLSTGKETTLPLSTANIPAPKATALDFVKKVCFIQDVTGLILTFPEDGVFSAMDEAAAEELTSIFNEGTYIQRGMKFSVKLRKPAIEYLLGNLENQKPINFRIQYDESFVEILDKAIQLGPMIRSINGKWNALFHDVTKWVDKAVENASLEVVIENAEVIEVFENWPEE